MSSYQFDILHLWNFAESIAVSISVKLENLAEVRLMSNSHSSTGRHRFEVIKGCLMSVSKQVYTVLLSSRTYITLMCQHLSHLWKQCVQQTLWFFMCHVGTFTLPPGGVQSDEWVCLFVCLPTYLRNHMAKLHQIFCGCFTAMVQSSSGRSAIHYHVILFYG